MILVDVVVPSVDKTYDFRLDEDVRIDLLLEEITEMIGRQERSELQDSREELLLFCYESRTVLNKLSTLRESGITDGGRLLLL